MSFKKSQTATEYLIILAVVVVIALIVVGILGGIPSIGGGVSEGSARAQLKTLPLGIENYASDSLNTRLIIQNNMPSSVRLTAMTIDGKEIDSLSTAVRCVRDHN